MAKYVLVNPKISIGTADFSGFIAQATLTEEADDIETTSFSSDGSRTRVGGLKSATVTLAWHQDFAAGSVDATLEPLVGSLATVVISPAGTAAPSPTSPRYTAVCVVTQYSPIDGAVGDLATFNVTWPVTGAVSRATA